MNKAVSFLFLGFTLSAPLQAEQESEDKDKTEHIQIIGRSDSLSTESGSATLIDEMALEKFRYDDIHRILANVPGVNIRQEDGYGLRPNIGFRGVTPERSKKINILEDGVLIGPAPYSAPAAYYFPMVNRMTSVEVFKGPSAIKYGPNTVAGTLNMTTRAVPDVLEGMLDLSLGSNGYLKGYSVIGNSWDITTQDTAGILVEYLSQSADGFKTIDNAEASLYDPDSGFEKDSVMLKLDYHFDSALFGSQFSHYSELKLSNSTEYSNETYMGLADEDFENTPYRRYAASQVGNMDWQHQQAQFTYLISNEDLRFSTRVYHNEFARAWRKVNGFNSAITLQEIMASPTEHDNFYQVLTGQKDSSTGESLVVGTNDRSYQSQGLQFDLTFSSELFNLNHIVSTGVRFHSDYILRDHFEQDYTMRSGTMTPSFIGPEFTTVNKESADAISFYVEDKLVFSDLEISLGARLEDVNSEYQNRKEGGENDWLYKSSTTWLYSVSSFYKLSSTAGIFAGFHEGYVPTSPKQPAHIKPERSVNYELGGRYQTNTFKLESTLFFNDFDNLKESCSFSTSASCTDTALVDQEYSGGEIDVMGLEFSAESIYTLNDNIDLPWSVTYTYTDSEFRQDLDSTFELWGNVKVGDPVPYLPDNQLTVNLGLAASQWQVNFMIKYIGSMAEAAGEDVALSGLQTDAYTIVDLSADYSLDEYGSVYLKIDNLTDKVALVSRRPFGARPSKPQQFFIGYKYQF